MIGRHMTSHRARGRAEMGKRGPTCSICEDPRVDEINRLIAEQEKLTDISQKFAVSYDALLRHRSNCIIVALSATPNTKDVMTGDNLLMQLQAVREKTLSLLDKAEQAADTRVYGAPVAYLREVREQIKLLAELEGKISSQPQITIINHPEWISLRTVIIQALDDFPEAKGAVINAIRDRR